jgi:hypothetical protein
MEEKVCISYEFINGLGCTSGCIDCNNSVSCSRCAPVLHLKLVNEVCKCMDGLVFNNNKNECEEC